MLYYAHQLLVFQYNYLFQFSGKTFQIIIEKPETFVFSEVSKLLATNVSVTDAVAAWRPRFLH